MRISEKDARRLGLVPKRRPLTPAQRLLAKAARGRLEDRLDADLKRAGYVEGKHYERQAVLVPGRKFSVDFCFRPWSVVIEVQGGIWMERGSHAGGAAISRDIAKANLLTQLGWRLYYLTSKDIAGRDAMILVKTICPLARP